MKHFLPKGDGSFFVVHESDVVDVMPWGDTTSVIKCRDGSTCTVEMSTAQIKSAMKPRYKAIYATGLAIGLAVGFTGLDPLTTPGAAILSVGVYRSWLM